jgi:hypothetical protein
MTVHLFGAGSSPGCANYGLKKTADDYEERIDREAANFIRNDFYVDDGLKYVATEGEAIKLIQNSKTMCAKGGLRLHKYISNSKKVIRSILPEDRSKGLKELDLLHDALPIERALGLHWCVETDTFQFRITLQDKPFTRRGILATVSSVYDPLGFVAPVVLPLRQDSFIKYLGILIDLTLVGNLRLITLQNKLREVLAFYLNSDIMLTPQSLPIFIML